MTQFAPVEAPPVQPPVINLVTSSRDPLANGDETNGRWAAGFEFQPELNYDPDLLADCSTDEVTGGAAAATLVQTVPWFVQAADHCSVMGYKGHDYIGRAVRALAAATPKGVEFEFWTGELAAAAGWPNLHLASPSATDVTPTPGTAVTIEEAINLLEQALADCGAGARGMIHCAPIATPSLAIVRRDAGRLLLTPRDTIVVPGVGYPGTSPAGATPAAGTSWLYATGMVDVRLGDITVYGQVNGGQSWLGVGDGTQPEGFDPDRFTPALVDRDTNDLIVPASRPAAAVWDGACHFAVLAQIPTAT